MREIVIGRGVPENRVFVHPKPNRKMGFKHKLNSRKNGKPEFRVVPEPSLQSTRNNEHLKIKIK